MDNFHMILQMCILGKLHLASLAFKVFYSLSVYIDENVHYLEMSFAWPYVCKVQIYKIQSQMKYVTSILFE